MLCHNELVNLCSLGSRDNPLNEFIFSSWIFDELLDFWVSNSTIGNIIHDGIIKEDTVLWNNGNVTSQIGEGHLTNVLAVDQYLSGGNIIESVEKSHDGTLA